MKTIQEKINHILNYQEKNIYLMLATSMLIILSKIESISVNYNILIFPFLVYLMYVVFFDKNQVYNKIFWFFISLMWLIILIESYYSTANHFFLTFYLSLLLFISLLYKEAIRYKILRFNIKLMLSIIMVFAALHKWLTPEFMDGSFIRFVTYKGSLFEGMQSFSFYNDMINVNRQSIEKIVGSPYNTYAVKLYNPMGNNNFAVYFSWAIILSELLFPIYLLIKNEIIKHTVLLVFLTMLAITRDELGFFSLLCIMFYALVNHKHKYAKIFSLFYILYFLLAISQVAIGFGKP